MAAVYVHRKPAPALAAHVEALWYYDGYQTARHKERVMPNGRFQLIIDLMGGPGVVAGMHSQFIELDTSEIQSVIGILFRPGGARAFFDVLADEFYNRFVTLDLLWGSSTSVLRDRLQEAATPGEKLRLLEAALLKRMLAKHVEAHPSVRYSLGEFLRAPHLRSVLSVTKEAGLSRRRFSQLFREQVGITPKLFCRVHRFQQVVHQIATGGPVDWADVALAGGYFDQPHLAHEFREFSGMTPSDFLAANRPFATHVAMD